MFDEQEGPAARRSEDFEDLYGNAPFGYLSMLRDGRITSTNDTLADWTGFTVGQLVGKRLHDILTIGTRILYETNYAPLLGLHGSFEEISLDLRKATGESLAVIGSAKTSSAVHGEPGVVRIAFLRATERRRYERQLVDAHTSSTLAERTAQSLLSDERETSMLREQFIAVLGHDLRNPLTSISGGLRLLQKDPAPERRKLLTEMLEASVIRMSGLIDNVLDFARGRLGAGIPLELRQDIWLAPVLEQVASELRIGVPDRAIETDFDLAIPVKCDPSRISQLVSNLIGNALTHGARGQAVRVHADANDGVLTIWVANGGLPIAPEAIERLFQPFFRGEVSPSQQGLGLGLHIAAEIAKAHGGTVTATSTAAETRFTFTMPLEMA